MKDAAALKRLAHEHRTLVRHAPDDGTAASLDALAAEYDALAEKAKPEPAMPLPRT